MAEDALAFRVLRLAKPTLDLAAPLKFDLSEDTVADGTRVDSHHAASTSTAQGPFADRVQMHSALDACGVSGRLMLSKSFGEAYLGEVSCSQYKVNANAKTSTPCTCYTRHATLQSFIGYVSLVNRSAVRATEVIVKVRPHRPAYYSRPVHARQNEWSPNKDTSLICV